MNLKYRKMFFFLNKLQENVYFFQHILIFLDVPVNMIIRALEHIAHERLNMG